MSWQESSLGLNNEDHNFLKVYKVAVTSVRSLFFFLFTLACPKLPTQTLRNYLQSPPLNMTGVDLKRYFNGTQRANINDATKASGKDFDISLLFVCIQRSCRKLDPFGSIWTTKTNPPVLEYLLTCNKNFRNDLLHDYPTIDDTLMNKLIQDLQDLVKDTYELIGKRYSVDVKKEIDGLNDNIDKIKKTPLPVPDVKKYQEELHLLRENIKCTFKDKGKEELADTVDNLTMTDPASFISRRETLKVTAIYTRIDLVMEENKNKNKNIPISYEKLLKLLSFDGRIPDVLILEGPAGAGKTTLSKLMLAEWEKWIRNKSCSFLDLESFDFVLHYECSNSSISRYIDLLKFRLQNTTSYFKDDDILRSTKQIKVLILIDAADDLNPNSKKLLIELFETHVPESRGNLRIICTTRPQALKDLKSMIPTNLSVVLTKIIGIPPERRGEFVEKLHEEMIKQGQSTQETKGLINYLHRSQGRMGDHFRFPLMLTLLTYLWAADPDAVNGVTTVTTLYLAIQNLIQKRLQDRLSRHETLKYSKTVSEIEKSCFEFQKVLYHESLISLSLDAMVLPAKCTTNLQKAADQHKLPQAEVFAAFLALERKWTAYGYSDQLAASHKSLLEFYAALYIINIINGDIKTKNQDDLELKLNAGSLSKSEKKKIHKELKESKTIRTILENNHNDSSTPMKYQKYQNLFIHLIGLLAQRSTEDLHKYYNELIDLMRESEVRDSQWFQVISEAECDSKVTKYVSEKMNKSERESWDISDSNMGAAIEMLHTVAPKHVCVNLETDPSTLKYLSPLCEILANSKSRISLDDLYSFKNPDKSTSDAYLEILSRTSSSCFMEGILGNYLLTSKISDDLDHLSMLSVAILDDTQASALKITLTETVEALLNEKLKVIVLHICKSVSATSLPRMIFDPTTNKKITFSFVLSAVEDRDIDWAIGIIAALYPIDRVSLNSSICFPKSSLSLGGCEKIIKELNSRSIIGHTYINPSQYEFITPLKIVVTSKKITEEEAKTLVFPGYEFKLDPLDMESWFFADKHLI